MKFDSKVSFKVKSKNQGNYVQISSKDFALLLLKDTHLGMHRKEIFCTWAMAIYLLYNSFNIQDSTKCFRSTLNAKNLNTGLQRLREWAPDSKTTFISLISFI